MKMSNLEDKLIQLAKMRKEVERLEVARDFVDDRLRETAEFAELERVSNELKTVNQIKVHLEEEIRRDTIQEYMKVSPEPLPTGITIKIFKTLKVNDEKTAKVWLANNAPNLLSYSDSKLLKAVENLEIDWAKVETEPRVQIASDLSKYLPQE